MDYFYNEPPMHALANISVATAERWERAGDPFPVSGDDTTVLRIGA